MENLDSILLGLEYLSLDKTASDVKTRAEVPVNARMIFRKDDSNPADQTLELWEKNASEPAISILIYRQCPRYNLRSTNTKAVALLVHNLKEAPWAAVSGWDNKVPSRKDQLRACDYVAKVKSMCASIGHILAIHRNDRGQAGRFYACHAEKQLLAYLFEHQSGRKHARIHQNLAPCPDCDRCLKLFVLATGITVTVSVHGENDGLVDAKYLPAPQKIRY